MAADLVGDQSVAPGLATMAMVLMDSADVSVNAAALAKASQLEAELAFLDATPKFNHSGGWNPCRGSPY